MDWIIQKILTYILVWHDCKEGKSIPVYMFYNIFQTRDFTFLSFVVYNNEFLEYQRISIEYLLNINI